MRQLRGCVELHGRDRAFSATRGVSRGTHSRRPPAPGPTDSAPATTPFPVLWAAPGCCRVLWCWGVHVLYWYVQLKATRVANSAVNKRHEG